VAKCWICSKNEANSGEHAIKQSLLKFIHGTGPYPKGSRLVKICDDKKRIVQSTDSKFLKFKKTICSHCNNAYSQPWDEEFDLFIFRLLPFWDVELRKGYFNLKHAHPGCERKHSDFLYRYFCKIFGCSYGGL
jgi:hypothetical protein